MTLSDEIKTFLKSQGADLAGFADLYEIPPDVRANLPFGVSFAVALNPYIIAGIKDGPNRSYYEEYERVNRLLDKIGKQTARFLEQKGYKALSMAATNADYDPRTLSSKLPHKTVATRVGLGWIGKCALLVTREFGSAVRLAKVLTDAPLAAGQPENDSLCGDCTACIDACPGRALTGRNWEPGKPRDYIYDAFACRRTSTDFEKTREGVKDNICGICIAACPWTQKYLDRSR